MTRILVVDDVKDNTRLLTLELEGRGYEVLTASGGRQGLDIAMSELPDVILLDVMMPDITGIEVCQRLKEDPRTSMIPVILVTAMGLDDNVVAGLDAGADDYVSKPYRREILAARIRAALRIKESYDAMLRANKELQEEISCRKLAEQSLRDSEIKFRTMASAAQDAIIMIGHSGEVSFWNDAAAEIFGYAEEEIIGKNLHDLLARPEDCEVHRQVFPRFQKTGQGAVVGKTIELIGLRKDGREVPLELSLSSIQRGGKWLALGIARDVTLRKRAEAALREERDRAQTYLDIAGVIIVAIDNDGRIALLNRKGHEVLGYQDGELVGQDWFETCLPVESRNDVHSTFRELVAGNLAEAEYVESHVFTKSGQERIIAWHNTVLTDDAGAIVGTLSSGEDITERKRAESALHASETRHRTLFDSSADAIMTLTAEDGFLSGNAATIELFGCKDEEDFCCYGPADLSPERQPDGELSTVKARKMMAIAVEKGSHFFEWTHRRVDGSEFFATLLLTRMQLEGKTLLQATARDITEQKEREAQIERLNRELVDASRRAGMAEVATGVLHNVGNVLNSVNVSANVIFEKLRGSRVARVSSVAALLDEHSDHLVDFLIADSRGAQVPAYLTMLGEHLENEKDAVLQELTELLQNIEHVKEIVNMQQAHSRVSGVQEVVRLEEVLDGAVKLNTASFLHHNVKIVREYEETPPLTIDKHRLLQILVNLIGNAKDALKASSNQDRQMILSIGFDGDRCARITVCDNGVGICQENMTKVFVHGFTTKQDGHGFGLHSSALAARELGGSLEVDSDGPGHGATFRLNLPLTLKEGALCTA